MSDHESEANPANPEVESLNGSFSSNGNDPGAFASAFDGSGQDVSFLDDLAKAMRTTAATEQARDAELTEQRRQAHLDSIRAREALEAEDLRELAKEDVKGIDAWSDGEIKRIKLERERRIASRREQLQVRLEEHRLVIASEVEAVEAALASYRIETERFFDRLGSQTDPVEIARQAGTRPPFPALDQIGPQETAPVAAFQAPVYDAPAPAPTTYGTIEPAPVIETAQIAETVETIEAAPVVEVPAAIDIPAPIETVQATETFETIETPVENVEAVEAVETIETPEPVVEQAVAQVDEHGGGDEAPIDPNQLIGVMDPEPTPEQVQPWESGVEAIGEPATAGDQIDEAIVSVENSGETQDGSDGSEEPVSVGAEARVVMPRTTGAGSWLRWPNSSIDRSDPSR